MIQNITDSVKLFFSVKRNRILTTAIVGTLAVFAVFCALTTVQYTFTVNGIHIGSVDALDKAENILTESQLMASTIMERDIQLSDVTIQRSLAFASPKTTNAKQITDALVESVDGIESMYVISVSGNTVGAVETKEKADEILDSIVEPYISDDVKLADISQDVTVQKELVNAEKINSDEQDILYQLDPSNESAIHANVITIEIKEYDEIVPCPVVMIEDASMYTDEEIIEVPGTEGKNHVTACIQCVNGEETDNASIIETVVLTQPTPRVVRRGTIVRPSTASTDSYIWPTNGIITSYFGYRDDSIGSYYHEGLDIGGDWGQSVVAADGGYVYFSGYSGNYGYCVKIQHDNGDVTIYAHLCDYIVYEGDRVYQGQCIGYLGCSGVASGPHLHFEIRKGGDTVNPLYYLP